MSSSPILKATSRTVSGHQVKQLRRDGQLPAVIYGHKQETSSLSLDQREFTKLFRHAGSTTLIDLIIDDNKPRKVLIHTVQLLPTTHAIQHVDFFVVNLKEKLQTQLSLSFVGTAEAVDTLGGTLITVKNEVEVECLPEDLIPELEVDISSLKTFADVIRISDLSVPTGMVILDDPEEVVVSIVQPRSDEDLAALEEEVVDTTAEVESETSSGTETPPPTEGA